MRRLPLICTLSGLFLGLILFWRTNLDFVQIFYRSLLMGLIVLSSGCMIIYLMNRAQNMAGAVDAEEQVEREETGDGEFLDVEPEQKNTDDSFTAASPAGKEVIKQRSQQQKDIEEWKPLELRTEGQE